MVGQASLRRRDGRRRAGLSRHRRRRRGGVEADGHNVLMGMRHTLTEDAVLPVGQLAVSLQHEVAEALLEAAEFLVHRGGHHREAAQVRARDDQDVCFRLRREVGHDEEVIAFVKDEVGGRVEVAEGARLRGGSAWQRGSVPLTCTGDDAIFADGFGY